MTAESFLLTNKTGGYALFSKTPQSRYEGLHFPVGQKMIKVIDRLRVPEEMKAIKNNHWNVQRFYDGFSERYFMPHAYSSLVYQADKEVLLDLLLDVKDSYDNREWGRDYRIEQKKDLIVITFNKLTSLREDKTEGDVEFTCHLAIAGASSPVMNSSWEEERYPYDESRATQPYSRYVFNALSLKGKKMVFSFSTERGKAETEARYVLKNLGRIMEKQHRHAVSLLHEAHSPIHDEERKSAYDSSVVALDSMSACIEGTEGIYAGLPWFFQIWTRDEAISLRAMMLTGGLKKTESILIRQMKSLRHDGRIPNRFPHSTIGSADGVGWVFFRISEFVDILSKRHILKRFMSFALKRRIGQAIESSIYHHFKHFEKGGLIYNHAQETWMDTVFDHDTREGFRIEIQALFLSMLKLRYKLTGYQKHLDEEMKFKEEVRKRFLKDGVLLDGTDDMTSRPNVFLAYYIYPELLSNEEWGKTFDHVLGRIWLPWGGVSSIDTSHPLFSDSYVALRDRSYHRGDSWYYINNIVAICLNRLDPERYADKIESIIDASTKEITQLGIDGYHAELSDAKAQTSVGCQAQAWSSATYVELMKETYG